MPGGVFICHRREKSAFAARAIHDRVVQRLDRDNVFLDVDSIGLGIDWSKELTERVGACDALIAVIGKNWISSADKDNQRRIDDPDDFVRIEIEAALKRDVRVIPVLVDGAAMPKADELPESLKGLARRQGTEVSHTRFDADVEKLTRALVSIMDAAKAKRQREERETSQPAIPARPHPEQAIAPPSSPPPADLSPPKDWNLERLILGAWYDRGENEYVISERSTEGGRKTHLQARQKNPSVPEDVSTGGAWVKGEIVGFNSWLPQMGGFEGRLVRSLEQPGGDTLVGKYWTAERSWDVKLYRSPAPPEPARRDVPPRTDWADFMKKTDFMKPNMWRK